MYKSKNIVNISALNDYIGNINTLAKGATIKNGKIIPNKHGYVHRNLYLNTYNIPNAKVKALNKLSHTYLKGKHRKIQGIQIIINPRINKDKDTRLNGHNPKDVQAVSTLGNEIAKVYASKGFPTRVATQADSTNGLLHVHAYALNYNIKNGKSIPAKLRYMHYARKPINKAIDNASKLTGYPFKHYFNMNQSKNLKRIYSVSNTRKATIKPVTDYLESILSKSLNNSITSKRKLKSTLKEHNIKIKFSNRRKYFINPYSNKKIPKRDSKNQIMKYKNGKIKYKYTIRPTITYTFNFKNQKHTIKGSTLNKMYSSSSKTIFNAKYIRNLIQSNQLKRYTTYKRNKAIKQRIEKAKKNALDTGDVKVLARNVSIPTQYQIKHVLGKIRPIQCIDHKHGSEALSTYRNTMKSRHVEPSLTEKFSINYYNAHLGTRVKRIQRKNKHPILHEIKMFKNEASKIKFRISKGAKTIGSKLSYHGFNRIGGFISRLGYKLSNHNKLLATQIKKSRIKFNDKIRNQSIKDHQHLLVKNQIDRMFDNSIRRKKIERSRRPIKPTTKPIIHHNDGPTLE